MVSKRNSLSQCLSVGIISPPTGCFETLQGDLGSHIFVGRVLDAWCPVRSSTKRIIPYPAQCLHILPDIHQERKSHLYYLSLKPFYVNTKLWGFLQNFHIHTASYRNAIAPHTERHMYVVLFQTLSRATHHFRRPPYGQHCLCI